jgi:hypothetical protein
MWTVFFGRSQKRGNEPQVPGAMAFVKACGRTAPCQLWLDYTTTGIAETKLQRPSPLKMQWMQQARA